MGIQLAGNILVQSNGEALPISMGGTGQTTAPTAINALLPVQTGQAGKILVTNGTNVSWSSVTMSPGGSDTMIQYNDAGSFGGNAFLVVNKSTGAITSTSTFKGIGLTISDSDSLNRTLRYQTLGSDRWLSFANNTTETGANSGSDFEFVRVADNGATSNIVYQISRATGVFDFKVAPTLNGSPLTSSTATSITGGAAGNVLYQSAASTTAFVSNGTSGQVLTSNGGSAPSWQAAPTFTGGTVTSLTTNTITMGGQGSSPLYGTISGTAGSGIGNNAAGVFLKGGAATNGFGGSVILQAGASGGGSNLDGNIILRSPEGTDRLTVTYTGAWQVGSSVGTSGQVLTSNGDAPPTWQAAASGAAAAGTLTGTTLASNVVSSSLTSVGTLTSLAVTGTITQNAGLSVGYLEVPQLSGTTFTLASSGKHFFNTNASQTYTIPANSSVAFPIGTAVTFVNQGSGTCTIAITTDTLYLAGVGTTGTRTLGVYGFATALKITATSWIISGTGLT